MTYIQPIDEVRQHAVTQEVYRYIDIASENYCRSFSRLDVVFNLRGRTAGMYRSVSERSLVWVKVTQEIRFNPWLFAKYPDDSWDNTIPHEVAHYITDCLYGLKSIKPHGEEWRQVMRGFNAEPIVRGDYDLEGIPVRKVKRYAYRCECREVELTVHRHRKIQRGEQRYRCKDCLGFLVENHKEIYAE